jgi:hypothetical protein
MLGRGFMGEGTSRRLRRWILTYWPELAALALGFLFRASMALTYDARVGFDFTGHWPYVEYLVEKHALPPLEYKTTTYHPPLYYLVAAGFVGLGFDAGALGWLAALWGMARLGVIWVALERWLPESRLARIVALFAAAIIPAGVQLDGMVTNETLNVLLAAVVFLLAPAALATAREGRVRPTVGLAVVLGLAIMTKVSATILVAAVLAAAVVDVARGHMTWRAELAARARPLLAGVLVVGAISGWFFVRNVVRYGDASPTGYEGFAKINQAEFAVIPYLDRRTAGFFVGWNADIYEHPYFPKGYKPHARFFPVMVATTFCDYYRFGFAGGGVHGARRTLPPGAVEFGRLSVIGGTVLALVTVLAWLGALRTLWRRADAARLMLLLAPAFALVGQLHFATKYPNDNFGPIKGAYMQFVAPALCGLYGLGVAWLWRRPRARVLAVVALAALGLVLAYVVYCRWPHFGPDAPTAAPFRKS